MGNFTNELRNYQQIPRDLVFDTTLTDRARFVFVYMASKPDEWDFFMSHMSKELGYSQETLRKYIAELVNGGWLTRHEQTKCGGVFGNATYTLHACKKEFTDTKNDRSGKKPTREISVTEKVPHIKRRDSLEIDNIKDTIEDNSVAKAPQHTKSKSKTDYETELKKRTDSFYNELAQYVGEYGKDMVRAFFDYWSEPTQSKRKMRFEMQKTWDLKRRLAKWESNNYDKQYGKKNELGTNNRGTTGSGSQEVYTEFKVYTSEELERIGFGAPTNKSAEKYTTF